MLSLHRHLFLFKPSAMQKEGRLYINATPHDICLYNENNERVAIVPKSPCVPTIRLSDAVQYHFTDRNGDNAILLGVPLTTPPVFASDKIEGFPFDDPEMDSPNSVLIVSPMCVRFILRHGWKGFLVTPNTINESAVRDSKGRIVGARGFVVHKSPDFYWE